MNNLDLTNFREKNKLQGKKIILVGGCFDVLHKGHALFLDKAKEYGEVLIVLLESDERIRQLKGENRPVNSQEDRLVVLKAFRSVDFVICLPSVMRDGDYDKVVTTIVPQIIATTKGDKSIHHKHRVANLVGAKVIEVTDFLEEYSTSMILQKMG